MIKNTEPEFRLDRFYYNYISYREQLLYTSIADAAEIYAEYTETLPYRYSADELDRIIKYIAADNPEYFYLDASSAVLSANRHKTRVRLVYFNTPDEIEVMKTELQMALDAAKMTLDETSDEFTKELELHDFLLHKCRYADANRNGIYNTAYGALVLGSAYPGGYAQAFKMLLDDNDIYNLVVYGTAKKMPHIWNMVYIGGRFYHVDTSWNDADLAFEPELEFHGYFNLSDQSMFTDHKPDDKSILPAANDDNNYYRKNDTYADSVASLDRIVYKELLEAGYASRDFIEIYLEMSHNADDYYDVIIGVIDRINKLQDDFKFKRVYRAYNASYTNNAMTIQFFYDN